MRAFVNTPVTKPMLIASLERHAAADNFIKGKYWSSGKGCAVGCSLSDFTDKRAKHSEFERLFGIPKVIAQLEDRLFERLPQKLAMTWPLRFANSVNIGADLSGVWNRYAHWLMLDAEFGVINKAKNKKGRKAIQAVGDGYATLIESPNTELNWNALRKNAGRTYAYADADADAAYAAAAAAAAYASDVAAADADAYAAYAADAAAAAYAADAADGDADADGDAAYAAYAAARAAYAAAAAYAADAADADGDATAAAYNRLHIIAQSEKLLALIAECQPGQ